MAVWSVVNRSDLSADLRIDAEYYRPEVLRLRNAVEHGPWPVQTVEELSSSVINFGAYSLCNDIEFQEVEEKDPDAVEFITAQDIQDGFIDHANARWIPARQHSGLLWKSQVASGQVLVAMAARLGHAAVYDGHARLNSSQDIAKITVRDPREVDPHYLAVYINSSVGRSLLLAAQTGSVQQHTNLGRIKAIPVVKLPRRDQLSVAELYRSAVAKRQQAVRLVSDAEVRLSRALGLDTLSTSGEKWYSRRFRELAAANRYDAEYFSPAYQKLIRKLSEGGKTIADVADLSERPFDERERSKSDSFRYIEIGSLSEDGEADAESLCVDAAPSRASWVVRQGDVITSTVRPVRRLSALIGEEQDNCVCSSGFAVLSPKYDSDGVEPELLLAYLRLPLVCELLNLHTTSSMYPAIPVSRLMEMPIGLPDRRTRREVVARVKEAIGARRDARTLIGRATSQVEALIAEAGNAASK